MIPFETVAVPALVGAVGVLLVGGLRTAGVRLGWQAAYAVAFSGWCLLTAELARSGRLAGDDGAPERLGLAGGLLALLLVATPAVRRAIDGLPLVALVAIHTLRLPVGLLLLAAPGATWQIALPELLAGASAAAVTSAVATRRAGRAEVATWNLLGFVALGATALLLLPGGESATSAWATSFPGAWVPTVLGESFLAAHLVLTRRVATESLILGPWLSLASMLEAAIATTGRRLVHGPLRPGWSWLYEATVTWLRDRFTALASSSPRLVRRHVDVVGGFGSAPAAVTWRWMDVGSVRARWAVPLVDEGGVVLFLHGGGYVFGSIRSHPGLIGTIAETTRRRVLAVDYRLAPEHPCPAALDDALAGWDTLVEEGWAPESVVVVGDSAGGGLALALLVQLRERGGPLPAGAVLISPWTDLALTGGSVDRWESTDYLGTREVLAKYAGYYLGDLPATDPRASPLYADLGGLPPLLVMVGACEMLLDDAVRVAEKARAADVEVTLDVEPDEVHVYPVLSSFTPRGAAALQRLAAWVKAR